MKKNDLIYVAGGTGLVGSAIIRNLLKKGYTQIVASYFNRTPSIKDERIKWVKLDLTNQIEVENFFKSYKPKFVFLAAAKVGGIWANNIYRADFIYQNLQIELNVIHQSYVNKVEKLLFLGSTCIYPKICPQPIKEDYLLTGPLEYTNEPYAIAKIAGLKLCESYNLQYGTNFLSVMPTNIYGINDNFDLETAHVLPALLRKFHLGKLLMENRLEEIIKDFTARPIKSINEEVSKNNIVSILRKLGIYRENNKVKIEIWGTGKPLREFLWADDLADACIYIMENVNFPDIIKLKFPHIKDYKKEYPYHEIRNTHINIGSGEEISIKDLAYTIAKVVGFKGDIFFNTSKPDGTPRKLTDISLLKKLGWYAKTPLEKGLEQLYKWYLSTI